MGYHPRLNKWETTRERQVSSIHQIFPAPVTPPLWLQNYNMSYELVLNSQLKHSTIYLLPTKLDPIPLKPKPSSSNPAITESHRTQTKPPTASRTGQLIIPSHITHTT